jgi:hypothetical protein
MPSLATIFRPALDNLRDDYLKKLGSQTAGAADFADDIVCSPFMARDLFEQKLLMEDRIGRLRESSVDKFLGVCAIQLARNHEGCTIDGGGLASIAFTLERRHVRIVVAFRTRGSFEKDAEPDADLLSQRSATKTTRLVQAFLTEEGHEQLVTKEGIHQIQGPPCFHFLSGDSGCWKEIKDMINEALGAKDIRLAEQGFRYAFEVALISAPDRMPSEAAYERSRRQLEEMVGPFPTFLTSPE